MALKVLKMYGDESCACVFWLCINNYLCRLQNELFSEHIKMQVSQSAWPSTYIFIDIYCVDVIMTNMHHHLLLFCRNPEYLNDGRN